MGREITANDSLAKAIRSIHYDVTGELDSDEAIALDIKDCLWSSGKLKKLEKMKKELEKQLVVEQGLSQFAIDMIEHYTNEVGHHNDLNEVFEYYTSRKHTVNLQLSKEDFESIRNDTYRKIKADLLESLGGYN